MEFTLGAYETWRDGRFGDRFAETSLSRSTVVKLAVTAIEFLQIRLPRPRTTVSSSVPSLGELAP